jgi:pimeloyl-ACP methyl ester carboxylesterase
MQKVVSNDGTAIAYERIGEGPALILIGGAFNDRRSDASGLGLAQQLAGDFTVYVYDRRGRGDSGDTLPYAVDREVEDLLALVAEVGGPVGLFGHSSGAALALRAAAGGGDVTRIALFEPPFTAPGDGDSANADLARRIETLVSEGRRGEAVEAFQLAIGIPPEIVAQLRHAPFRPALEAIAHTLAYDMRVLGSGAVPVELARKVDVPALVVVGANSPESLRHAGKAVAGAIPGATMRVIDAADHSASPEQLARPLAAFF